MKLDCCWYAVQTKPRRERIVAHALEIKNYRTFYPVYRERRRWSDRQVEVERPLFPGYVFCEVTRMVFGKLVQTPGLIRIVGFGGKPADIPGLEIETLRRINSSKAVRAPCTYVPNGTRVCIESGPFQGIEGVYSTDGRSRRLIVSVTILLRSVAVILDPEVAIRVINQR